MPGRNLHQQPFDEGTRDKLELYREYLREWLPVFINGSSVDFLQIFDFFAGPGFDVGGNPGRVADSFGYGCGQRRVEFAKAGNVNQS